MDTVVKHVVTLLCEELGVHENQVYSTSQEHLAVWVRGLTWLLFEGRYSLTARGQWFPGRNGKRKSHATVYHGMLSIQNVMLTEKWLVEVYNKGKAFLVSHYKDSLTLQRDGRIIEISGTKNVHFIIEGVRYTTTPVKLIELLTKNM